MLSIEILKESGIIPNYAEEHTEDYVKGSYKGVSLEISEAILKNVRKSHNSSHIVFRGIYVLLSMNKNFSGKTVVKHDYGAVGNWLINKTADMDRVRLEDPVFEKKFEVYSTDQVEARYLLTTSFMERLLELSQAMNSKNIQCSFYSNKLLLSIPTSKNYFETSSIYEPATFVDDINDILREMNILFKIIDILKLDQRTGL
ncbi:MAG: DUF3137 domain-containing protein [Rickettsiales bacterium]